MVDTHSQVREANSHRLARMDIEDPDGHVGYLLSLRHHRKNCQRRPMTAGNRQIVQFSAPWR